MSLCDARVYSILIFRIRFHLTSCVCGCHVSILPPAPPSLPPATPPSLPPPSLLPPPSSLLPPPSFLPLSIPPSLPPSFPLSLFHSFPPLPPVSLPLSPSLPLSLSTRRRRSRVISFQRDHHRHSPALLGVCAGRGPQGAHRPIHFAGNSMVLRG